MKNAIKLLFTAGLLACSYSAYGLADLQLGLGFSSYDYADNSQPSAAGANFQATALFSIVGPESLLSFVAGPRLKYDYLTLNETTIPNIDTGVTYKNAQDLGTLQLGGEAGLRIHPIPLITIFTTGFATMGIYNILTNDLTDPTGSVISSKLDVSVTNYWQAGFSGKGMFSVLPFVAVGGGFEVFKGSYKMSSFQYGNYTVESVKYDYSGFSVNLLASLSF